MSNQTAQELDTTTDIKRLRKIQRNRELRRRYTFRRPDYITVVGVRMRAGKLQGQLKDGSWCEVAHIVIDWH